ncbi:MAG: hypothetical protein BWY82_01240 [Verrucomicrobia bacterium ADurb.Bin474]|nr:MAG: hypothetical protein BWY82_01240 [Verrucomicrobia bacterium ADurb.Bin474]
MITNILAIRILIWKLVNTWRQVQHASVGGNRSCGVSSALDFIVAPSKSCDNRIVKKEPLIRPSIRCRDPLSELCSGRQPLIITLIVAEQIHRLIAVPSDVICRIGSLGEGELRIQHLA